MTDPRSDDPAPTRSAWIAVLERRLDRSQLTRNQQRGLVFAALALLPWSVQLFAGAPPTVRFVWGMVSLDPFSTSTLVAYVQFSRASIVFDWLLAAGLFALALAATLIEAVLDRRDGRVAAGLLALSGLANLSVAWAFSAQPGRFAVPIGTAVLGYVAWRWWRAGD